jgi:hypothetical protein
MELKMPDSTSIVSTAKNGVGFGFCFDGATSGKIYVNALGVVTPLNNGFGQQPRAGTDRESELSGRADGQRRRSAGGN